MLEVLRVFPTIIGRLPIPDAEAMNVELKKFIVAEEAEYPSLGRSNIGEGHSRPDFLNRSETAISAFRSWLDWGMRCMIGAATGAGASERELSTAVWMTICRSGAYHAPHCHPDCAWSGVHYVDAGNANPDQPLSGVLEFLDPRSGVDGVTSPGDLHGEPFRVLPLPGLLVIFPSWLYLWVHPYTGQEPRIAISFNNLSDPVTQLNGRRTAQQHIDKAGEKGF